jgi:hypothetical protein
MSVHSTQTQEILMSHLLSGRFVNAFGVLMPCLLALSPVAALSVTQASAQVIVPAYAQPGPSEIQVRGHAAGVGQEDVTTVQINIAGDRTLVVTPNPATAGQDVKVAASGFSPGENVTLSLGYVDSGSGGALAGASAQADQLGQLNAVLAVPVTATAGTTATLEARGDSSAVTLSRDVGIRARPAITVQTPGAQPGATIKLTGSGFLPRERVFLTTSAFSTPTTGVAADASGTFIDTASIRPKIAPGVYAVAASGGLGSTASTELTVPRVRQPLSPAAVQSQPNVNSYFAEGFTGEGPTVNFGETLDLLNTSAISGTGSIQYFIGTGITKTVPLTIPAHTQLSEDVQQDVGKNQAVSAVLDLPAWITATRTITRTTTAGLPLDSTISAGESTLSDAWYFAEGYTGATFQEYLAILNPGTSPAQVMVQVFGPASSSPAMPASLTVAPSSRSTLNIRSFVPGLSIGLLVTSDQPVAAERVLYWGDGSGSAKYGASVSSGVLGPAATCTFPYVSTAGGDQAFLSFIDPSSVSAHLQFTVVGSAASVAPLPDLTVEPGTRATIQVMPGARKIGGIAAIIVHSDVPIVGEQAQYFGGSPNSGEHTGSVVSGADPALRWAFAGAAVDAFTSDTWYVLNPGPNGAHLTATSFGTDGQIASTQHVAASGQLTRLTLNEVRTNQPATSVLWSSNVPISIVRVLRSGSASVGNVVTGAAITQSS